MKPLLWIPAMVALGLAGAASADARPSAYAGTGWPGTGPTILVRRDPAPVFSADGLRQPNEYFTTAGEMITVAGTPNANVYLKRFRDPGNGQESLRIFFAVNDDDVVEEDFIDLAFDRNHDHAAGQQDDVLLRIRRVACDGAACGAERMDRNGGIAFDQNDAELFSLSEGQVIISHALPDEAGFGIGWSGEIVVRPSDLGWGYFPGTVGVWVRARDDQGGTEGSFPAAVTELQPASWGHLQLRYPIDFALSLDYSGSMTALDGLTDNRWVRAKRAADLFAATLGLFRDNAFDDRIAVSQYSWSCSDESAAGDATGAVAGIPGFALLAVPAPPVGMASFTSANNTTPPGNNCTPIRRGLEFALNTQLGFSVPALAQPRDRVVVLLSDGFHNMPSAQDPFNPGAVFNADHRAFADVATVALGPDGSAGTLLLSEIATTFQGMSSTTKYNQATDFTELLDSYLAVVQDPFTINAVGDDLPMSAGGSYLPGAADKVVVIGVWNDPSQASAMTVHRDGAVPAGTIQTFHNKKIGYAAVSVTGPTAGGTWTINSTADGVFPNARYVLVDLRILARFPVAQRNYTTGEPILLRVALTDNGAPLLGAQARVEIARPGEALGNYLATVQANCERGQPQIPQWTPGRGAATTSVTGAMMGPPAGAAGATGATGDPIPGRYALAADRFQRCQKPGLDRDTLAGEPMFDDGTHGDEQANDGVYSLSYTDTNLEGSYNFRITARGTATDGVSYSRTRRFSQFVQVKPAPENTAHTVQMAGTSGDLQNAVYWFLPRDRYENYLGPGFAGSMQVSTLGGGSLAGPLQDVGNGWYGQGVQFPRGAPVPPIRVAMPTTGFVATFDPRGSGGTLIGPGMGGGRAEWEIFGSYTMLDPALDVDDALGLGIRFAAPLASALRFELEGATTFPELGDDSVRVSQLFAGLRLEQPLMPSLIGSVSAGGGLMHFQNGDGEMAGAGHGSAALTLLLNPHLGIRGTGRVLYIGDVRSSGGSTTGTQLTLGIVFRP
jgi:hypothetical protein